jgi:hypothetical protein
MSKIESGQKEGVAYLNDRLAEMMAAMEHISPQDFVGRLLDKLMADGFVELKPGCSKEKTASAFAAAFKNLKVKIPAGS